MNFAKTIAKSDKRAKKIKETCRYVLTQVNTPVSAFRCVYTCTHINIQKHRVEEPT